MYIMGENPAMSDPDTHHSRKALAKLDISSFKIFSLQKLPRLQT